MAPVPLSRAAGELLLRIIDQNPPVILQMTLNEFDLKSGSELVAAGALVPDGFARSITLFEDEGPRNVDLLWLDQKIAYGYFSASDGLVVPDQKSLQLYRADFGWWFRWVTAALDLVNAGKPLNVVPDACWILGDIWVSSRIKVPLVFAKGLRSRSVALDLAASLSGRTAPNGGIVLTTTRQPSAVAWPDRFDLKGIQALLNANSKHFEIEKSQLVARWTLPAAADSCSSISLSPDNRILMLQGRALHLRGPVHQSIVRKLYSAHLVGKPARTRDVLSKAGPQVDTIAKAFHRSPLWEVLRHRIRSSGGLSWFDI
jgi:hypothetical protein